MTRMRCRLAVACLLPAIACLLPIGTAWGEDYPKLGAASWR